MHRHRHIARGGGIIDGGGADTGAGEAARSFDSGGGVQSILVSTRSGARSIRLRSCRVGAEVV